MFAVGVVTGITLALLVGLYFQAQTHSVSSLEELRSKLTKVNLEDLNGNPFTSLAVCHAIIRNAIWIYGFVRTAKPYTIECLSIIADIKRETSIIRSYRKLLMPIMLRSLFRDTPLLYTDSLAEHYKELRLLTIELCQEMGQGELVHRLEGAL